MNVSVTYIHLCHTVTICTNRNNEILQCTVKLGEILVLVLVPTNSVVEWFSSLFVPNQGGLSLIGYTQRWEKKQHNKQIKHKPSHNLCVTHPAVGSEHSRSYLLLHLLPLMRETSMSSWTSFSQVLSMHSYTDWMISLGSSSTHLVEKQIINHVNTWRVRLLLGVWCREVDKLIISM